jgi:hypothetical protein
MGGEGLSSVHDAHMQAFSGRVEGRLDSRELAALARVEQKASGCRRLPAGSNVDLGPQQKGGRPILA